MQEGRVQSGMARAAGAALRRPVAVVTDSATALPRQVAVDAGLQVAPMEITIGSETFEDGPRGLTGEQFALLKDRRLRPQTAAPRPGVWLEKIRLAGAQANSVLCVTLAAKLSASYDAARTAAGLASTELAGTEVRVFDSDSAAGSEALVALAAARQAAAGAGLDEVEQEARKVAERVRLLAYLDTLEYVWRSGRVPRIAVWASSLLDVKPVMEWYQGKVGAVARPRSRRKAADRILAEMERDLDGGKSHVVVMHSDAPDDAEELRSRIAVAFKPVELHVTPFAAFMAAHTGPGLVGAAFWRE